MKTHSAAQDGTPVTGAPEFPEGADDDLREGFGLVSRRGFIKSLAAAALAAQLGACTKRSERSVPYVHMPEHLIPGRPELFATSLTRQGIARGVLVESHLGRPTRIEGNPRHPESLGAVDSTTQAEILTLYDPDRSRRPLRRRVPVTTAEALESLVAIRTELVKTKGEGTCIVTEPSTSPTFLHHMAKLLEAYPQLTWIAQAPVGRELAAEGTRLAFGFPYSPVYRFDHADAVLSLGGDFLFELPGSLRYARDFVGRRKGTHPVTLLCAEPTLSLTGCRADTRIAAAPDDLDAICRAAAAKIGVATGEAAPALDPRLSSFVDRTVSLLLASRGRAVVVPGEYLDAGTQAICHLMNHALGASGKTVDYITALEGGTARPAADLLATLRTGAIRQLLLIDVNPLYHSVGEPGLVDLIKAVPMKVHAGLFVDETTLESDLHLPLSHELEQWGDGLCFDGSVALRQPLIEPLYGGWSPSELVSFLAGSERDGYTILTSYWGETRGPLERDRWWERALQEGVIAGTARDPVSVAPRTDGALPAKSPEGRAPSEFSVVIRPDPALFDGRYANNGWLQELPNPLTKQTWGNALLIAPARARALGIASGDLVELGCREKVISLPAIVVNGLPENTGTVALGHGRSTAGKIGNGVGTSIEPLRTTANPWILRDVAVRPHRGEPHRWEKELAPAFAHGRSLGDDTTARRVSFKEAEGTTSDSARRFPRRTRLPIFDQKLDGRHQWGMSIDLNCCIGCNACVTACQSENNIPYVGKEEVSRGREMHWIRVDASVTGPEESPDVVFQPIPCMHCEQAPCELVCPVGATVHSSEGLNEMVYNRCVGTRYCSNNCPYKVRRFNFFHYTDEVTPLIAMLQNPDVTVRTRGVMEKCTYCVQRIEEARIAAARDHREIAEGEVRTACQQACPTRAIVFGDLTNPQSAVSQAKSSSLSYSLLEELETRPRTTYLPRLVRTEKA